MNEIQRHSDRPAVAILTTM